MWLLSPLQDKDAKEFPQLFHTLVDMFNYMDPRKDVLWSVKFIRVFEKPLQSPKKESDSYRRLVPLSDTTHKEEK